MADEAALLLPFNKKRRSSSSCAASFCVGALIWILFLAWLAIFFVFPTISLFELSHSAASSSAGSAIFLGVNGLVLLVFGAPIILIAILAAFLLQLKPKSTITKRKRARLSLWTHPILTDGLLGVVSAAELLFVVAAFGYLVWAMVRFVIRDSGIYERFMHLPEISGRYTSWQLWTAFLGLSIGLLGLLCLCFLFLPVARGSPLLRLIDIPFEHAVKYHVWLGHLTMVIFTIHGLCYVVVWASQKRLIEEMLEWQSVGVANLPGVISLVAGILLWMTSFGVVRQGFFELFFYTHQLYIVFLVFMAFHIGAMSFCICAAGIFLYMLDRFLRFCQSRRGVSVLSWRVFPCGTIEVVLPRPQKLKYNALSFIFLNVPGLSLLQWHPFSVSSSPYDSANTMSFLIKPLGSWTADLQMRVKDGEQSSSCPLLGVEGPYGHESDYYLRYEALVLVAGGIGISPFIAIIRDLLHRYNMNHDDLPREVTLIWAVKTSKELGILNLIKPASICPDYSSRLNLTIQAYVTRETEADLEAPLLPIPATSSNVPSTLPSPSPSLRRISTLVGTYSNIWMALYIIASTTGFIIVQGLMQQYYLGAMPLPIEGFNPSSRAPEKPTLSETTRAAVLLLSMTAGMVLFGGLVLFCWNWIDSSKLEKPISSQQQQEHPPNEHEEDDDGGLLAAASVHYGRRPDMTELFEAFTKKWKGVSVGVLLCGPSTLQASVARECKLKNSVPDVAFHYHSVSFDL